MPRLYPAYLLDAELKKISLEFMKGNVSWCPSAPYVRNERDLDMVVREMTRRAQLLKLEEFFICNFDKDAFMSALPGLPKEQVLEKIKEFDQLGLYQKDPFQILQDHFLDKLAHGPERRQVSVKLPDAAIYFVHLNN